MALQIMENLGILSVSDALAEAVFVSYPELWTWEQYPGLPNLLFFLVTGYHLPRTIRWGLGAMTILGGSGLLFMWWRQRSRSLPEILAETPQVETTVLHANCRGGDMPVNIMTTSEMCERAQVGRAEANRRANDYEAKWEAAQAKIKVLEKTIYRSEEYLDLLGRHGYRGWKPNMFG